MNKLKGLGFVLIVIGAFLILGSFSGITGFAVFDDLRRETFSVVGIITIITGLLLMLGFRDQEGGLATIAETGTKVMISKKALERADKNNFITHNWSRYLHEIRMIQADPKARQTERIGEFNISPRGRSLKGLRVAWHYDGDTDTVYIDDVLYHEKEGKYVDNWNDRARKRQITQKSYKVSGYEPLRKA